MVDILIITGVIALFAVGLVIAASIGLGLRGNRNWQQSHLPNDLQSRRRPNAGDAGDGGSFSIIDSCITSSVDTSSTSVDCSSSCDSGGSCGDGGGGSC